MQVTLKKIADELNLSVNTVSRGLRDMPDISQSTKMMIRETADRLGYRKNLAASRLRTNRSYIIGVVVTDYCNPVMSKFINGIEMEGKKRGYTIMTGASNECMEDENAVVNNMIAHGVDGIILIPTMLNEQLLHRLDEENICYVVAGRRYEDYPCNSIVCDDIYGSMMVAEMLYQYGHRRFLYISGLRHISSAKERLQGFQRKMLQYGIAEEAIETLECNGSRGDAKKVMQEWLGQHGVLGKPLPVSAVFAFSDYVACGVYSALKERGYRIPEDISVIGYDNSEISDVMEPGLTTVDNHFDDFGQNAARRLIQLIAEPEKAQGNSPLQLITLPELVVRQSVSSLSAVMPS